MNILEKLKTLIKRNKQEPTLEEFIFDALENEPRSSAENGYKIGADVAIRDALLDYLKQTPNYFIAAVKLANEMGFISLDLGKKLESLFLNKDGTKTNYDIYIKTIHSNDMESIFREGVRCLGHTASGGANLHQNISKVNIHDAIEPIDSLVLFLQKIKTSSCVSQGLNPIDHTMILTIPKGANKEDILYLNKQSKTFNINPEYIVGAITISQSHMLAEMVTPEQLSSAFSSFEK